MDWSLWAAKARIELASLLMASTSPLMPCLFISAFDSSISSLLCCRLTTSLCLLSSLSSHDRIASAMMEALFEIADPTSSNVPTPPLVPSPSPPPDPLFLLFAGESEYSLVSESDYRKFPRVSIHLPIKRKSILCTHY